MHDEKACLSAEDDDLFAAIAPDNRELQAVSPAAYLVNLYLLKLYNQRYYIRLCFIYIQPYSLNYTTTQTFPYSCVLCINRFYGSA